jgi:hypothetical protein
VELKAYLKQRRRRNRTSVIHFLPESKNFTWDCLVSSEEIFEDTTVPTLKLRSVKSW